MRERSAVWTDVNKGPRAWMRKLDSMIVFFAGPLAHEKYRGSLRGFEGKQDLKEVEDTLKNWEIFYGPGAAEKIDAAFGRKEYRKERNRMSRIKTHGTLWSAGNDGC